MMTFPRRTLAALAAFALTLSIAAPIAGARATQSRPAPPRVETAHKGDKSHKSRKKAERTEQAQQPAAAVTPGASICALLVRQLQFARTVGNLILVNLIGRTLLIL